MHFGELWFKYGIVKKKSDSKIVEAGVQTFSQNWIIRYIGESVSEDNLSEALLKQGKLEHNLKKSFH